jgi:hypothetical protein
MSSIQLKGFIRQGRVVVSEPVDLPEGSEVTISGDGNSINIDKDRPMTSIEIAETLAAMQRIEPFDMTDEERASADAWERQVNAYTIANLDRDLEGVLP